MEGITHVSLNHPFLLLPPHHRKSGWTEEMVANTRRNRYVGRIQQTKRGDDEDEGTDTILNQSIKRLGPVVEVTFFQRLLHPRGEQGKVNRLSLKIVCLIEK